MDRELIRYAVSQKDGSGEFRSLMRSEGEGIADFMARVGTEFGDESLILFKGVGGHVFLDHRPAGLQEAQNVLIASQGDRQGVRR